MGDILIGLQQMVLKCKDLFQNLRLIKVVPFIVRGGEGDVVGVGTADFLGERNRTLDQGIICGEVCQIIGVQSYFIPHNNETDYQQDHQHQCNFPASYTRNAAPVERSGDPAMGIAVKVLLLWIGKDCKQGRNVDQ
ncbi:hypothetical protein DSECCO2_514490 [anaerobic digester metagenome]